MAARKAPNPEAALVASVAKNTKIRILEEHQKRYANDMALATWDSNLGKKSVIAERKRNEEMVRAEEKLTSASVKRIRQQKIEELFRNEEHAQEEELKKMGLSYRRDRT